MTADQESIKIGGEFRISHHTAGFEILRGKQQTKNIVLIQAAAAAYGDSLQSFAVKVGGRGARPEISRIRRPAGQVEQRDHPPPADACEHELQPCEKFVMIERS